MLLIPAIDLKDGHCVRLKQGDMDQSTTFGEDPAAMARRWVNAGARRLHLVDLNGAFAGYLLLLPAQVFSLVMYLLMQMILAAQLNTRALRVDPWQLEAIVYGYQVGVLVLPTLAPILVWLWLDQQFFRSFFMSRWKQS